MDREVRNFTHGLIDSLEAQSIPDGAASSSLNWLTKGDKIELAPGYKILGDEDESVGGKITGLHVAERADGTLIPFRMQGRKVLHLVSGVWTEIGSDAIPPAADGEDISPADYNSLSGNQLWLNSPNMGMRKIMVASPTAVIDHFDAAKNFKGRLRIRHNRSMCWARKEDQYGVYGSYVDAKNYTTVSTEALDTGDGAETDFSGTLVFKASGAKRTCFAIEITDGTETFTDDFSGNLTGDLGGTGTIDYASGDWTVSFATAPDNLQSITADYQWEDATDGGIADYTKSGTRLAGEGFVFAQDDGGPLHFIGSYGDTDFCLHRLKTWALTLTDDDTNATNLTHRQKAGTPNHRAAVETADGIYFIDDSDPEEPKFKLMTLSQGSSEVVDVELSQAVDLSPYRFNLGTCAKEGYLLFFACRRKDSVNNDTLFIYNTKLKALDVVRRHVSCFANRTYDGEIIAGDSLSNNVMELFEGWTSNGSKYENYWTGNITDHRLKELKRTRRLALEGEIGPSQVLEVYMSLDRGSFVQVGEIRGDASYVDSSTDSTIGSPEVGIYEIGGGTDGTTKGRYLLEFKTGVGKYRDARIRFRATGIGYASVSMYTFKDIIRFADRVPKKYRA